MSKSNRNNWRVTRYAALADAIREKRSYMGRRSREVPAEKLLARYRRRKCG